MNFFRRKWNILGGKLKKAPKVEPDSKAFRLGVDVLNYTPIPYRYTEAYVDFLRTAPASFLSTMKNAKPDDMNLEMFDSLIDARLQSMRASVGEQYIKHLEVIEHHKKKLAGELVLLNGYTTQLTEDLKFLQDKKAALPAQAEAAQLRQADVDHAAMAHDITKEDN